MAGFTMLTDTGGRANEEDKRANEMAELARNTAMELHNQTN